MDTENVFNGVAKTLVYEANGCELSRKEKFRIRTLDILAPNGLNISEVI